MWLDLHFKCVISLLWHTTASQIVLGNIGLLNVNRSGLGKKGFTCQMNLRKAIRYTSCRRFTMNTHSEASESPTVKESI